MGRLECNVCCKRFSPTKRSRLPVVANCGHTFCVMCVNRLHGKCSNCRQQFRSLRKNYLLIDSLLLEKETRDKNRALKEKLKNVGVEVEESHSEEESDEEEGAEQDGNDQEVAMEQADHEQAPEEGAEEHGQGEQQPAIVQGVLADDGRRRHIEVRDMGMYAIMIEIGIKVRPLHQHMELVRQAQQEMVQMAAQGVPLNQMQLQPGAQVQPLGVQVQEGPDGAVQNGLVPMFYGEALQPVEPPVPQQEQQEQQQQQVQQMQEVQQPVTEEMQHQPAHHQENQPMAVNEQEAQHIRNQAPQPPPFGPVLHPPHVIRPQPIVPNVQLQQPYPGPGNVLRIPDIHLQMSHNNVPIGENLIRIQPPAGYEFGPVPGGPPPMAQLVHHHQHPGLRVQLADPHAPGIQGNQDANNNHQYVIQMPELVEEENDTPPPQLEPIFYDRLPQDELPRCRSLPDLQRVHEEMEYFRLREELIQAQMLAQAGPLQPDLLRQFPLPAPAGPVRRLPQQQQQYQLAAQQHGLLPAQPDANQLPPNFQQNAALLQQMFLNTLQYDNNGALRPNIYQ